VRLLWCTNGQKRDLSTRGAQWTERAEMPSPAYRDVLCFSYGTTSAANCPSIAAAGERGAKSVLAYIMQRQLSGGGRVCLNGGNGSAKQNGQCKCHKRTWTVRITPTAPLSLHPSPQGPQPVGRLLRCRPGLGAPDGAGLPGCGSWGWGVGGVPADGGGAGSW
jgi:hypothetical protein